MCGACPGGSRLSEATVFLGLRSAAGRGARLLEELTRGRLRITRFGDGWTVVAPTGGMRTSTSFEEVALWCVPFTDPARAEEMLAEARVSGDEVAALVAGLALGHRMPVTSERGSP
jgi:hypothetical protein